MISVKWRQVIPTVQLVISVSDKEINSDGECVIVKVK